jgi:hypothetical protein
VIGTTGNFLHFEYRWCKLQTESEYYEEFEGFACDSNGGWVKFSDVEALLSASTNSAMDAICASEEYESSEISRGVKCISRAFLAGVKWHKQHQ